MKFKNKNLKLKIDIWTAKQSPTILGLGQLSFGVPKTLFFLLSLL